MPCVLIVEDDADVCEFMHFLLTANGYETMSARNGRQALEQIRTRRPCMVLLDLHMPVMDGFEFRKHQLLDPNSATVPVVAVTAHFDAGDVERRLGVRCIGKPIHIEEIITAVRFACGRADVIEHLSPSTSPDL
jgi:CheY-like chemotaxis protein